MANLIQWIIKSTAAHSSGHAVIQQFIVKKSLLCFFQTKSFSHIFDFQATM